MTLLLSLRSEMLKTKRTAAFYFTLAAAAFVPSMFLLNAFTHGLPNEDQSLKDPLNAVFSIASEIVGVAILPLFIVLVCTLLPQIEYKNNTWKQVLASPQSKSSIFITKFLNIHLLILLFLLANQLFMWIYVLAAHFLIPEIDILHQPLNVDAVLSNILNMYVTTLAMGAIQFWMGLRFRNFLVPLALGLVLWIFGILRLVGVGANLVYYNPYSFPGFGFITDYKPRLAEIRWKSCGYAMVFLIAGFLDFRRRSMSK